MLSRGSTRVSRASYPLGGEAQQNLRFQSFNHGGLLLGLSILHRVDLGRLRH